MHGGGFWLGLTAWQQPTANKHDSPASTDGISLPNATWVQEPRSVKSRTFHAFVRPETRGRAEDWDDKLNGLDDE